MSSNNVIISVFKTNITHKRVIEIKPFLDLTPQILKWSVDLEDCDNILRIESNGSITQKVLTHFTGVGISCEELQD